MKASTLRALNKAKANRQAALLLTSLDASDEERLLLESDIKDHSLAEPLSKMLRSGKSGTIEADSGKWFVNVHTPPPRLVVIGAVHISQALAPIAAISGFDMTVIDPRTAFATKDRFPDCELIADWPQEVLPNRPLDAYTALAAVTHDPKIDDHPLMEALSADCFYVGALGGRRTNQKRLERLAEAGLSLETLSRIHAPIGLDIGASSPAEIAVAIMAEVIEAFRKRGEPSKSSA